MEIERQKSWSSSGEWRLNFSSHPRTLQPDLRFTASDDIGDACPLSSSPIVCTDGSMTLRDIFCLFNRHRHLDPVTFGEFCCAIDRLIASPEISGLVLRPATGKSGSGASLPIGLSPSPRRQPSPSFKPQAATQPLSPETHESSDNSSFCFNKGGWTRLDDVVLPLQRRALENRFLFLVIVCVLRQKAESGAGKQSWCSTASLRPLMQLTQDFYFHRLRSRESERTGSETEWPIPVRDLCSPWGNVYRNRWKTVHHHTSKDLEDSFVVTCGSRPDSTPSFEGNVSRDVRNWWISQGENSYSISARDAPRFPAASCDPSEILSTLWAIGVSAGELSDVFELPIAASRHLLHEAEGRGLLCRDEGEISGITFFFLNCFAEDHDAVHQAISCLLESSGKQL